MLRYSLLAFLLLATFSGCKMCDDSTDCLGPVVPCGCGCGGECGGGGGSCGCSSGHCGSGGCSSCGGGHSNMSYESSPSNYNYSAPREEIQPMQSSPTPAPMGNNMKSTMRRSQVQKANYESSPYMVKRPNSGNNYR